MPACHILALATRYACANRCACSHLFRNARRFEHREYCCHLPSSVTAQQWSNPHDATVHDSAEPEEGEAEGEAEVGDADANGEENPGRGIEGHSNLLGASRVILPRLFLPHISSCCPPWVTTSVWCAHSAAIASRWRFPTRGHRRQQTPTFKLAPSDLPLNVD